MTYFHWKYNQLSSAQKRVGPLRYGRQAKALTHRMPLGLLLIEFFEK